MIKLVIYNKNVDQFIRDLQRRCEKYKITFLISGLDYVKWGEEKSNGFFNPESNEMAISIGKPVEKWLDTLVHESCHFDQWVQNCKTWRDMIAIKPDACTQLFEWVFDERKLSKEKVMKMACIMRDLELDCERRSVEKIKKYKLPIDTKEYCQKAGAYVMFYNYIVKYKKWYKIGKEPYNNKKIKVLMPTNLNGKYDKLTPKLEKLYKECI